MGRAAASRREWLRRSAAGAAALALGPAFLAPLAPEAAYASPTGVGRWPYERQLGPLTLHADFAFQAHPTLVDEVGSLREQLQLVLGLPAPREEVHLVLFKQKTTYQSYLKQYYPRVPYRRALYIKDRGPGVVYAYRSAELETDLRHETTHALLHAAAGDVPLWLDEGLAEYFEASPLDRARGHEYLPVIRGQVRGGTLSRVEDLEALDDVADMGAVEYQRAWAWVHFCLHGSVDAHDELRQYLADVANGGRGPNFSDRLRRRCPDLEVRFVRHFRGWQ